MKGLVRCPNADAIVRLHGQYREWRTGRTQVTFTTSVMPSSSTVRDVTLQRPDVGEDAPRYHRASLSREASSLLAMLGSTYLLPNYKLRCMTDATPYTHETIAIEYPRASVSQGPSEPALSTTQIAHHLLKLRRECLSVVWRRANAPIA